MREISLLTYHHYIKEKILDVLREEIKNAIDPILIKNLDTQNIIEIH